MSELLELGPCPECGCRKLYVEANLDGHRDVLSKCSSCGEEWGFPFAMVEALMAMQKATGQDTVMLKGDWDAQQH